MSDEQAQHDERPTPDQPHRPLEPASAAPAPAPAATRAPDRAEQAGYPPDHGPEQKVLRVRRSWIRARPFAFTLAVVFLIAGLVGVVHFKWFAQTYQWVLWPALIVAVGSFATLGYWWIMRLASSLEITNKRSIQRTGLLSKSTSEVLHDSIRNVTLDQSVAERIFKVGTLGIASAGQDGIEIQCKDVPDPEKIRKIIDLYRPLD